MTPKSLHIFHYGVAARSIEQNPASISVLTIGIGVGGWPRINEWAARNFVWPVADMAITDFVLGN